MQAVNFESLQSSLQEIIAGLSPECYFAVFDIDRTLLFVESSTVIENPRGKFVHDLVQKQQLPILYITARPDDPSNRQKTIQDLAAVGIVDPVLIMRPNQPMSFYQISQFKRNVRYQLEMRLQRKCGLNVGDQWTDLVEGSLSTLKMIADQFVNYHVLYSSCDRWSLKLFEAKQ